MAFSGRPDLLDHLQEVLALLADQGVPQLMPQPADVVAELPGPLALLEVGRCRGPGRHGRSGVSRRRVRVRRNREPPDRSRIRENPSLTREKRRDASPSLRALPLHHRRGSESALGPVPPGVALRQL